MLDMIQALGGSQANLGGSALGSAIHLGQRPDHTQQPHQSFGGPQGVAPTDWMAQLQALQGNIPQRRFDHLQQRLTGLGGSAPGVPGQPPAAPGTPQTNPALPPQPLPPQAAPWQAPVNQMIAPPQNMVGQSYGVQGMHPGASPFAMPTY